MWHNSDLSRLDTVDAKALARVEKYAAAIALLENAVCQPGAGQTKPPIIPTDIREVYGEYDPPYNFNKNPTEEEKEAAEKIIRKYEELAAEKKSK